MIYFFSMFIATAQTHPPNTVLENALYLELPPEGFQAVLDSLPVLLPPEIPVDDLSGEGGFGSSCFTNGSYAVSNLNISLNLADATIIPQTGYLDLAITIEVQINNPNDPFDLDYEVLCDDQSCLAYVDPFPATVTTAMRLEINDLDGDGINDLDVIFENTQYSYDLASDDIHIEDCALGTFETLLNLFGWSVFDLVLSFAEPALEEAVEDLLPELEETLEDGFSSLYIQETFDLEGAEVDLSLAPSTVTIQPEGLRLSLDGGVAASESAQCISSVDPNGSLASPDSLPAIGDLPNGISSAHLGAVLTDDFVNQALYTVWRTGLLCYTVDESLFALDTSILNLLTGDSYVALFPETQPMIIITNPQAPPTLNMDTSADLAVDVEKLGLDFFTTLDHREARVLSVDLSTDVGVTIPFEPTTGEMTVEIDLDTNRITSSVGYNELTPESTENIEDNFSAQLDTILGLIDIEGLLGDLNFILPSLEGIGVTNLETSPSGQSNTDLGMYTTIGVVPYTGGCDDEDAGCDGGCSSNGQINGRFGVLLFVFIFGLLRRHSTQCSATNLSQ